jgi:hypothetical protein
MGDTQIGVCAPSMQGQTGYELSIKVGVRATHTLIAWNYILQKILGR